MSKAPESVGHLNLTTAGKLYLEAKAKQKAAEDHEWDKPSPENMRFAKFWAGQAQYYAGKPADEVIPLH